MLVKEVMARPVFTISEDLLFPEIIKLLLKKKVSGVSVLNKKGRLVGVISEKDLLHKLFPSQKEFYKNIEYYKNFEKIEFEAKKIKKLKARNIMTKKVITVEPENHVLVACSLMAAHNIRRLPVVKEGKLVGIVTTGRLYKNYLSSFLK